MTDNIKFATYTTAYDLHCIVYNTTDVKVKCMHYGSESWLNIGAPKDIDDLVSRLRHLDIGWWYFDELGRACVESIHEFREFVQQVNNVINPIES